MAKDYHIGYLIDFYGSLLSDRQRDIISLYYEEDLSLAEIAEDIGITRQGVRDAIKKAESILAEAEEKLGLAERFKNLSDEISRIKAKLSALAVENDDIKPVMEMIDSLEI